VGLLFLKSSIFLLFNSLFLQVAVKIFNDVATAAGDLSRLRKTLSRELRVWSRVDHPNITPLCGFSSDFHRDSIPCLVSPYYINGNITSYLKVHRGVNRMALIAQISVALSYLHGLRPPIIHGDIKGSNVLINDIGRACLADFGLSRILGESGFSTKTESGTWRYMAHELITPCGQEEELNPPVTAATDVWAFAMTVIEILTSHKPFFDLKRDINVIAHVQQGGRPKRDEYPQIEDKIWTELEKCWAVEANQRPSMETLSQIFTLLSAA